MNKTSILKAIGLLTFCIPLFASCIPQDAIPPQPEENPLYLSSDAQTVTIKVEYLSSISAEDPERDKEILNMETEPHWKKVENEWISFYLEHIYSYTKSKIIITVQKNDTGQERRYKLNLHGHVSNSIWTVIQEPKYPIDDV